MRVARQQLSVNRCVYGSCLVQGGRFQWQNEETNCSVFVRDSSVPVGVLTLTVSPQGTDSLMPLSAGYSLGSVDR